MSFHICNTNPVLQEIADERDRQDDKWGPQDWPDGTVDALRFLVPQHQRQTEKRRAEGKLTWRDVLNEEITEAFAATDPDALRRELVQIGAVAVAWIEAIDRRSAAPSTSEETPT